MVNNNHGIDDDLWVAVISEVRSVLVECAGREETPSYVGVANQVKTIPLGYRETKDYSTSWGRFRPKSTVRDAGCYPLWSFA